ncbi:MAG: thiamine-phosphate kinase [Proteobacteria bacterium]|nr:thiamine-phosphate kinase [Pseudomonadota bacterium]
MRTIGDAGEFSLIERIARRARTVSAPGVRLGIGDDAALLRLPAGRELVVTSDALVEGVHFRLDNQAPAAIGRRALAVNLSDLAAMGAKPVGFTLALQAPASLPLRRFDGLLAGLVRGAAEWECPLVGGNLARARELSLAVTALGSVVRGRALRRGAARPGDRLFVTGRLGVAALARARAERSGGRLRHQPTPRLAAGRALARLAEAGACIDLSDGLRADLGHLLAASRAGARVDYSAIPRPRGYEAACRSLGLDPQESLVAGGEDYELLFTTRARGPGVAALARRLGVAVTEIGAITRRTGLRGLPLTRGAGGWTHF